MCISILRTDSQIWEMGRRLNVETVDVNREVRTGRKGLPLVGDGIHYCCEIGWRVGKRLGYRAVVFLGDPRALRRKI